MHIGNVAVRNVKFSKLVPKNLVAPGINQLPRCIYVINRTALRGFNDSSSAALRRNGSRPAGHRLQQQACRHKRQRPAAGRRQQTACRLIPLRFRRTRRQEADDTLCIIFPMVLRNFRNNYVTVPYMAPDNLIRLIHGVPPSLPPVKDRLYIT